MAIQASLTIKIQAPTATQREAASPSTAPPSGTAGAGARQGSGPLPRTGADRIGLLVVLGTTLALVGAAVTVAARRRDTA